MPIPSRHVEIFVTNSALCEQVVLLVRRVAGSETKISVHDVRQQSVAERVRRLGLSSFPAVVVNDEALPFDPLAAVARMLAGVDLLGIFKAS